MDYLKKSIKSFNPKIKENITKIEEIEKPKIIISKNKQNDNNFKVTDIS